MEVPGVDEVKKGENHVTSAAAFVEGGIQDACDDACSICLESFCESDPSSVTSCKHEFHLQCILEWCQRSSNCPMCWQSISLKDPSSQELFEAVERERSFRFTSARNAAIFHHPILGDFELQHLPVGMDHSELEDRIIQHLTAAAVMGRSPRVARRDGPRGRSSAHPRPQYVLLSPQSNTYSNIPVSASQAAGGIELDPTSVNEVNSPVSPTSGHGQCHVQLSPSSSREQVSSPSGSLTTHCTCQGTSNNNKSYFSRDSLPEHDRAGPSELQSFSDSWKSRLTSVSMKYKESISKSTKGWKEKLFSRSSSIADIGPEVRREMNAGIASVSRVMERLESRDHNRPNPDQLVTNQMDPSVAELSNRGNRETPNQTPSTHITTPVPGSSISSLIS